MSETFTLSIFTIEADQRAVLSFAAKRHEEADAFFRSDTLRDKLRLARSAGRSLYDHLTILHLRLANAEERARYREHATGGSAEVFLIELDAE